ncbi:hypothetical protein D3C80_850410 [compost metagenome]
MGAWMQFLQGTGALVGADKGEHINFAAGHQGADGFPSAAIDHIDHPSREAITEGFEQWTDQQHTELGRFEYHSVAHDQGRNQSSEGFVQRVVVGTHAQSHAQRHATDLTQRVLLEVKTAGATIQLLERGNGVNNIVAGAIELLFRVLEVFADFPHQQFDHRATLLAHARQKSFNVLDALGHTHSRPQTLAPIIGADGGVESDQRRPGVEQWRAAEDRLLVALCGAEEYRAAHRRQRACPGT